MAGGRDLTPLVHYQPARLDDFVTSFTEMSFLCSASQDLVSSPFLFFLGETGVNTVRWLKSTAAIRQRFLLVDTPLEQAEDLSDQQQATTAMLEVLNCGYILEPAALQKFSTTDLQNIVGIFRKITGTNHNWPVMYPGFPQEVIEKSDIELWFNAVAHYFTFGEWLPDAEKEFERRHLEPITRFPHHRPVTITHATSDLFTDLWSKAVAPSHNDIQLAKDLAKFLKDTCDISALFSATSFNNGERFTMAVDSLIAAEFDRLTALKLALIQARNVDYVFRAILTLYCKDSQRGYDLHCSRLFPVHMLSIPKAGRRAIIAALSRLNNETNRDLAVRRQKLFSRVLRKVHPYSIKGASDAKKLLDVIHSNGKHRTFNAQVELALANGEISEAIVLLQCKPGLLLRRLDHLLRLISRIDANNRKQFTAQLLAALEAVGDRVRLTTIVSAINGLRNRDAEVRVVRIPHKTNYIRALTPQSVDQQLLAGVLGKLEQIIMVKLQQLPLPEGAIAAANTAPVELVRRDLSDTLEPLARGQRISLGELGEDTVLRLFVHWFGQDVDLGVVFMDETLTKQLSYLDFTNIAHNKLKRSVTHSGDIISAPKPNGAAEFIDIRISQTQPVCIDANRQSKPRWRLFAKNKTSSTITAQLPAARYAIASVISYQGGTFCNINNYAGVMLREGAMSGEIFEPRTVVTGMRIHSATTSCIPFMVDLNTLELIWLDSSLGTRYGFFHSGDGRAGQLIRAELQSLTTRMTNGQLLTLWLQAHSATTTSHPSTDDQVLATEQVAELLEAV